MNTKTDPYATKLQRRIDALLFVFIVVVIALLLRPAAKGETLLATAFSSVRQPFWSTLAIFTSRADSGSGQTRLAQFQNQYDQAGAADRAALTALFSAPASSNFSPMVVVENRRPFYTVAAQLDQAGHAKSFSAPSALRSSNQISGFGSALAPSNESAPALRAGYPVAGTDAREASSSISNAIDVGPRYVGEESGAPFSPSISAGASQTGTADIAASYSVNAQSAPVGSALTASSSSDGFSPKSQIGHLTPKAVTSVGRSSDNISRIHPSAGPSAPSAFSATLGVMAGDDTSGYGTGNWASGGNSGYGFGAWSQGTNSGGYFAGSSTGNAGGSSGGNINDGTNGRAWGMYSNTNGSLTDAYRSIGSADYTDTAINRMAVGQTLRFDVDNGYINTNQATGYSLRNGGTTLFEFFFKGGDSSYTYSDSTGTHASSVSFTGDGLRTEFTLTGNNTYTFRISTSGGTLLQTVTGTISDDSSLNVVRPFTTTSNGNSTSDAFFNNLRVKLPTWVGASNGNWSTPGNWSGGNTNNGLPINGNSIAFNGGSGSITATNDTLTSVYNISFNKSVTALNGGANTTNATTYTLTGNALTINGGIDNNSSNLQTISNNLTLGAAQAFNATGGALTLNGSTLANGGFRLTVSGANNTSISNVISGSGDLLKQNTSTLTVSGNNTFGGNNAVFLDKGTISVATGGTLGATNGTSTGWINIGASTSGQNGDGVLTIANSGVTLANPIDARYFPSVPGTVTVGGGSTMTGTATFSGTLALHDNVIITSASGGIVQFTGQIQNGAAGGVNNQTGDQSWVNGGTNGGGVTLSGLGTIVFSNNNSYVGSTSINSGALTITNNSALGTTAAGTSVASGAVLRIDGTAGDLSIGAEALTLNGTGLAALPAGALRNIGGSNSFAGAITLGLASNIQSDAGLLGLTGGINNAGFGLTFQGAGNSSVSGGALTGSGGLTKTGAGTLFLGAGGTTANTYTGLTTVTNGLLVLNKLAGTTAIAGDGNTGTNDVSISGGTLQWGASNQVADNASITMSSGAFSLNGFTDTIYNLSNSGGTFTTGTGTLHGTGASITWSGGTNTVNNGGTVDDAHLIITGGTNTVEGGVTGGLLHLLSGGAGLEMTGSTLTLNSDNTTSGRLLLEGNVTSHSSSTTSTIATAGGGTMAGRVDLGAGSRTFTVEDGAAATDMSITAKISNGSLVKDGDGNLALTGANTYGATTINGGTLTAGVGSLVSVTGSVTVNSGGTLLLSGTGRHIGNAVGVTLNGGTFNTAGLSEPNTVGQNIGALTLSSSSVIDLASGASILAFAQSNAQTWTGTLSIYNWSGTLVTGNGTDQLIFGLNVSGLTLAQLNQISFYSGSGTGFLGTGSWALDLDGEVVPTLTPVPEPSTWLAAFLALGAIAWTQRKRFAFQKAETLKI